MLSQNAYAIYVFWVLYICIRMYVKFDCIVGIVRIIYT